MSDPRKHRYGMGRLTAPDPRDQAFPMAGGLPGPETPVRDRPWRLGATLYQGETSSCTGHACAGWLMAEPIRTHSGPSAFEIYAEAQKRDPWKGVIHEGSTVRAAVQYLMETGHIASYLWAWDVETVTDWLLHNGTIIMGTHWYRGMFRPDAAHIIHVTGPAIGGHAWHLTWFDVTRGLFRMQNSWGEDWEGSDNGKAWISGEDLTRLIHEDGECCAPIELRAK